jgi:hypothetical protein
VKILCRSLAVLLLFTAACSHRVPPPAPPAPPAATKPAAPAPPGLHSAVIPARPLLGERLHTSAKIHAVARHADGTVFYDSDLDDLRTTGGADWQANVMGATSGQPAAGTYMAATNDSAAPAVGDCAAGSTSCTLPSEITSNGLSRKVCTYAHSNGTASYSCQVVYTATGTQAVQKFGLFNASSSGTMIFEGTIAQVTLNNTDTLTMTWAVTY